MARFIARRLIGLIIVLFAVSVIVFVVFNVMPLSGKANSHHFSKMVTYPR